MDLTLNLALFYAFAAVLVIAALGVISVKNSVHAALLLVLTFVTSAALWLLMQAEFLAIALVLVYVGAVMVLFLFVVMMLDINFDNLRKEFRSYIPVGATVGILVLVEMALTLVGGRLNLSTVSGANPVATGSNTKALGTLVYTEYVYPFELASVILLVAIIAAIALTHRKRKETRYQNPAEQVKVRPRDRLRILNIPSEKREP